MREMFGMDEEDPWDGQRRSWEWTRKIFGMDKEDLWDG